ncbi:ABC transporter substrate-binding protein [Candidatus Entotheonella palauensis]|nr:ABC transporter substrate-binding protein [Candidatus Entotheonella palauensis]
MDQQPFRPPWLTRRGFLGATAGAAAGAYGLSLGLSEAAIPNEYDGSQFKLKAPEPNAKSGGLLKYGVLSAPAHFDVHQSGTCSNMCTQGAMYDNLVRRNPLDSGKTIIPDLAHSWEIAKDGKTYTFFLRKGVKFHDGAELTSADVKATFDRIVSPPKGISIPRTPLFATVSEINARDKYTIEFKLSEPRPVNFIMGAFASGWNIIVRKKTLEDTNYNLRDVNNYPGTGPWRHVKRVDKEVWVMDKNPDYWNEGQPYLDQLEVYHLPPFTPQLGSALLSGRVDYGRALDPVTAKTVQETEGMTSTAFYQSVIQAVWVNNEKKPFDDPRVRRALHLVLDKPVLVDVVRDVAPMLVGGFIYPFSEFATPSEELSKRLGYQTDPTAQIKEAQKLMAAAGYPDGLKDVDFVIRDAASFKLWSVAIQAMLKETLKIESNLRMVQVSVWFDEAQAGNYDLTLSAIVSTLMDPSDYFNAWYTKDGPQNYSRWNNPAFDGIVQQIDRELDDAKRKALIRKAEAIMEQDPPLLPVSWERLYDGWFDYVKGHNPHEYFGVYDVNRFDTMWLDK